MHDNIKIAIFMGYNIRQDKEGEYVRTFDDGSQHLTSPDCFDYDASIIGQMQVLEKIEGMGYGTMVAYRKNEGYRAMIHKNRLSLGMCQNVPTRQEAIYKAIIQFLYRHTRYTALN